MGMFDYCYIESAPEEFGEYVGIRFQTKSLDQFPHMGTYVVKDGSLYEEVYDWELIEDPSYFLGSYMQRKPDTYRLEHRGFTGIARMVSDDGTDGNFEYMVTFEGGVLRNIEKREWKW